MNGRERLTKTVGFVNDRPVGKLIGYFSGSMKNELVSRLVMYEELEENPPKKKTTFGLELISKERQRQIDEKGCTAEHDDQWVKGELSDAAACYALSKKDRELDVLVCDSVQYLLPRLWPWLCEFKPTPKTRIRELAKAGALIAAEIDRIKRASNKEDEE
jgi:hypothetical protein